MTKTEYRQYIGSEGWQRRRKSFLETKSWCNRCMIPRRMAVIAYDQDLNVHHRSYANLGQELDSDLEPLCKRCHEIETFGFSNLHKPQPINCVECGEKIWYGPNCESCNLLCEGLSTSTLFKKVGASPKIYLWVHIACEMARAAVPLEHVSLAYKAMANMPFTDEEKEVVRNYFGDSPEAC